METTCWLLPEHHHCNVLEFIPLCPLKHSKYYMCWIRDVMFVLIQHSCKGKAVPLQAWSGPEGSRKLHFPDFMTTAQDGGKVVSPTHRPPLPPGNDPGTHIC